MSEKFQTKPAASERSYCSIQQRKKIKAHHSGDAEQKHLNK
jgi:hypothetical protein